MLKKDTPILTKIDLQLFSGDDDDFILPDDEPIEPVEPTEPQEPIEDYPVEPVEPTDPVEPTEPVEPTNVTEPVEDVPKLKIKYNHEEMELGHDEAIPLIQKGMNYDKLQERLQSFENDPRIGFVEAMASEYDMSPQEFIDTAMARMEQARLNQLIQQNIPEELAQEILESRKVREQRKAQEKAQAEQQNRIAEVETFQDYYKQVNGKFFDFGTEKLPDEVWQEHANGMPLKQAYIQHENAQLRNKIKVLEQNAKNIQKAPITGVTTHGSNEPAAEDPFLEGFNSY